MWLVTSEASLYMFLNIKFFNFIENQLSAVTKYLSSFYTHWTECSKYICLISLRGIFMANMFYFNMDCYDVNFALYVNFFLKDK